VSATAVHRDALERAKDDLMAAQAAGNKEGTLSAWFAIHRLIKKTYQTEVADGH
jgi:hypothetical protein